MDGGLGQHAVVLELGLAERRSVAGDDDELGLARAERLEGGLVAESDLARLSRLLETCSVGDCSVYAHLDRQRKLGVDAVGGLVALLWCHFCG